MPNQLKVQSNRTEKIAKRKQLREKDYKNAILKKKLVKQNDGRKSQVKTYFCEIAKPQRQKILKRENQVTDEVLGRMT